MALLRVLLTITIPLLTLGCQQQPVDNEHGIRTPLHPSDGSPSETWSLVSYPQHFMEPDESRAQLW